MTRIRTVCFMWICLLLVNSVQAQLQILVTKKYALVIGNGSYPGSPLKNSRNDSAGVAKVLRRVGFEVTEQTDLSLRDMSRAIDAFAEKLHRGDLALFYFSGHGIQAGGENYLLPVNFEASSPADVPYTAYAASRARDKFEQSGARLRIVILDASRVHSYGSTRSVPRGLVAMKSEQAEGTFIAFAAGDNSVADDNPGGNGLFTTYLMQALETPGLSLGEVFRRVKEQVYRASNGRQNPFTYDNVVGDFYFVSAPREPLTDKAAGPQIELTYWNSIKDSANRELFQTYLRRYPEGHFVEIARAKLIDAPQNPITFNAGVELKNDRMNATTLATFNVNAYHRNHWCPGILRMGSAWVSFEPSIHSECAGVEAFRLTREQIGSFGKNRLIGAAQGGFNIKPHSGPTANFSTLDDRNDIFYWLAKVLGK